MKNINYYENKAAYEADENRPVSESTVSSVNDGTGLIFSGKNILVEKSGAEVGDILVFDKTTSSKKFIKFGTYHSDSLPASITTHGVVWKKTEDKVYVLGKTTAGSQRWAQGYKLKLTGFDFSTGGSFTITVNSDETSAINYSSGSNLAAVVTLINTAINAGGTDTALKNWTVVSGADYIAIEHNRHIPVLSSVTVTDLASKVTIEPATPVDYQKTLTGVQTAYGSMFRNDKGSSWFAGIVYSIFYSYYYANGADTATNQAVGAGDPVKYSRYNLTDNPNIVNYYGAEEAGYGKYIEAKMAKYPYSKGATLSRDGKSFTGALSSLMFTDADGSSKPCYPACYAAKNYTGGNVVGYTTGLEGEWYLLSAVELIELLQKVRADLTDKVNQSLSAIGATTFNQTTSHWTSSESSSIYAWFYYGTYGYLYYGYKNASITVRPIVAF